MAKLAGASLLAQYLVRCPNCGEASAAHVDECISENPVLVRFVCPRSCRIDDESVLPLLRASA